MADMSRLPLALVLLAAALARADDAPRFVDVDLGPGNAHRNVFGDLDGDGWVDLVVDHERVFRNVPAPGGGRTFARLQGGLAEARPDLLLLADWDDDGDQDALVGYRLDPTKEGWQDPGRRTHVRLYAHDPAGAVAAVESRVAFTLPPEPYTCAASLDYDLDGRLDLVVAGDYVERGLPLEAWPLHLWRGLGGGRFEEVTDRAGLTLRREPGHEDSRRSVYGLGTADVDGDGWTDLLVCAYGRQRNLLFMNRRDGTFQDVGLQSGFAGDDDTSGTYPEDTKRWWRQRFGEERQDERPFRSNGNTFGAPAGDFDNDGDLDLFLAEITHAWAGPSSDRSSLLENLGGSPPRFRRDPEAMPRRHAVESWNQGDLYAAWADVDNDGRLDLLLASGDYPDDQRLRLFRQRAGGGFEDATAAAGLDVDNAAQLSLADYDRDGGVDVLTGITNMRLPPERTQGRVLRPRLLRNQLARGRWLELHLVGRGAASGGSNRDAVGARASLVAGDLRLLREVHGGTGHAGQLDARPLCFGLGDRARVDRVVVRWPTRAGTVTVLEGLAADRVYRVTEPAPGQPARVEDLGPH